VSTLFVNADKCNISPSGDLDAEDTAMLVTTVKPMLVTDDHSLSVKNENNRSCCRSDKTVSSTLAFKPSPTTASDCDADQALTADCRAFKAVSMDYSADHVAPHHSDASESFQLASVNRSNPHQPILERRQKTLENYDWDIEPSSCDEEEHSSSGQCQTHSDNGRPSSLSEPVGAALGNCDGSDGECFSESDEEGETLQKDSSAVQQIVGSGSVTDRSADHRCASEEATATQTIGQYCEQNESVLLLTEGDNTMNRLFGEISDSDSESCGKLPEKTTYPFVVDKGKGDFEDGEIDDSETERRKAPRSFTDKLKDNKKDKLNVHNDETVFFKRRSLKSESLDVAKSSGSDHSNSKRNDQSSSSDSRRNSVKDDDARRNSRLTKNYEGRRSDVRRDRNDLNVEEHRRRRLRISPRKQSSRKRSPVIRSPLRTRTAENVRHSTTNSAYRSEPADRDRNDGRRRSPARPRIAKK